MGLNMVIGSVLKSGPMAEKRIKMVALDLDGTLLKDDKSLSERNIEAIRTAVTNGVIVIIATARPPRAVEDIYNRLGLGTPTINYNGSLVYHPPTKRVVHHHPLGADLAAEITYAARGHSPGCLLSAEIMDKWYTDLVDNRLPTETSLNFEPDFLGGVEKFIHQPITKLQFLLPETELNLLMAHLLERFGDRIATAVSDTYLLQIMQRGVSKGAAITELAQDYGVERDAILAIGDAPNDLPLFEAAGMSLAVGNAWDAVKAGATGVLPSNEEDGVAVGIEQFVLNKNIRG